MESKNLSLSYLIVGQGRLANHFKFFFQSNNIRIHSWHYKTQDSQALKNFHDTTAYTLLCIPDSQIESFIHSNDLNKAKCVHFSGALHIPGTIQFHPLMTFSKELMALDSYSKFAYIGIKGQPKLQDIFPFLTNPYFEIDSSSKAKYHALCVLSGNFTHLLWQKALSDFKSMNVPASAVLPYMTQIFENIKKVENNTLTGPLVRRDINTIQKNLDSLSQDPYFDVYKSFVNAYDPKLIQEINL